MRHRSRPIVQTDDPETDGPRCQLDGHNERIYGWSLRNGVIAVTSGAPRSPVSGASTLKYLTPLIARRISFRSFVSTPPIRVPVFARTARAPETARGTTKLEIERGLFPVCVVAIE